MANTEHDATLHGPRKWVVASFCARDPYATCQFIRVGGVALGFVFKTCSETTQQPCRCWSEDGEPEHFNVGIANCIAGRLNNGVMPGANLELAVCI